MYEAAITSKPSPAEEARSEIYAWLQRMMPVADETTRRYAVTLTLDIDCMRRKSSSGLLEQDEKLALARQNFASFRRRLDLAIFKNAAVRYGRELDYVPVIEGQGPGDRIHYHCVIIAPSTRVRQFPTLEHRRSQ